MTQEELALRYRRLANLYDIKSTLIFLKANDNLIKELESIIDQELCQLTL